MTSPMRVALAFSAGLHGALLIGWPAPTTAQFDVQRAPSSLEIFVMAAPPQEPAPQEPAPQLLHETIPPPLESPVEPAAPPTPPPAAPAPTPAPEPHTVISEPHQGVITDVLPGYLKNPAPRYPRLARERGEEGTVIVEATVSSSGRPAQVSVLRSSGFPALDQAAVSAIARWVFRPATRWGQPVDSSVQIPVTFRLVDAE